MNNISIEQMQKNAAAAESMLKSLGNSHRLMVLCHLVSGEMTVGDLEAKLKISQSSLSQHLAKLRKQKIVGYRKDGTTVYYRITDEKALAVLQSLYSIYCAD